MKGAFVDRPPDKGSTDFCWINITKSTTRMRVQAYALGLLPLDLAKALC